MRVFKQSARLIGSLGVGLIVLPAFAFSQQTTGSGDAPPQPGVLATSSDKAVPAAEQKRLFWIIPNYRTSSSISNFQALTPGQKFKIASQDSFDRGTVALAALFAGESQLSRANPSFGNGVAAYARYFGTSYADFVIGNFMTEAIFPIGLHQDPRFFRKGQGSAGGRMGYALSRLFVTHGDSGATQFNYSEVLGNSVAVAISNAYYQDNRDAKDAVTKLATQLAVDGASNVLKEFAPDIYRKLSRKHKTSAP